MADHYVARSIEIRADPARVWREITQVDLASLGHPAYLSLFDVPRPLRADVSRPGVGGVRTALFDNGLRFTQRIVQWEPPLSYAFTFQPDPGFRVGYVLDLCDGPFRMHSGEYCIAPLDSGVALSLSSRYSLEGVLGFCLGPAVRLVLHLFQTHLLRGIKSNSERVHQERVHQERIHQEEV